MKNVRIIKWLLLLERLLEISTKKRSQTFYKPIDVHSVTNETKYSRVDKVDFL